MYASKNASSSITCRTHSLKKSWFVLPLPCQPAARCIARPGKILFGRAEIKNLFFLLSTARLIVKRAFLLLLLLAGLGSHPGCRSVKGTADTGAPPPPTVAAVTDTVLYDPPFLEGLSASGQKVGLDSNVIVYGKDTAYFPAEPDMYREHIVRGTLGDAKIVVTLRRNRLTSLDYSFQQIGKDNFSVTRPGKALLRSFFFLDTAADAD